MNAGDTTSRRVPCFEPHVGMILEDRDPRMGGRRLRVERIDARFVYCAVVRTARGLNNPPGGRAVRIAITRLRPTRNGYARVYEETTK